MPDHLEETFREVDGRIRKLENAEYSELGLEATINETLSLVKMMMRAYRGDRQENAGVASLADSDDPLAVFRAFVKGDPSLNAVRDNLRELVYYHNCIDSHRLDALPPNAAIMAVRTVRHIYLYLRTRLAQSHRLTK